MGLLLKYLLLLVLRFDVGDVVVAMVRGSFLWFGVRMGVVNALDGSMVTSEVTRVRMWVILMVFLVWWMMTDDASYE